MVLHGDGKGKPTTGKARQKRLLSLLIALAAVLARLTAAAQGGPWVSAYYAGWMQGNDPPCLPANRIDLQAVTHVIHFALIPVADGTLDDQKLSVGVTQAAEIVRLAHAAGRKVLISIGGEETEPGFAGATAPAQVEAFVNNILSLVIARGYDGVDIDWEPLSGQNAQQYASFITMLRKALKNRDAGLLLTAAVVWQPAQPALFAQLAQEFDQINLMTYDLSGPWDGWVTWHNAPVYDGGSKFPSTGATLPSANGMVEEYLAAGVPKEKLGIGIDFYGFVWQGGTGTPTGGVTAPLQGWLTPPAMSGASYAEIMDAYASAGTAQWDAAAQAAYIGIDGPGSDHDTFITYDNEKSCLAKVSYVRTKQIGGMIIWELGGGWRPAAPVPDLLLQTIKQALSSPTGVQESIAAADGTYRLDQNFPNPFNPKAVIGFHLAEGGPVNLTVYDNLGREVTTLINGQLERGSHTVIFDGSGLPSGVYFYRIRAGHFIQTRHLTLIR